MIADLHVFYRRKVFQHWKTYFSANTPVNLWLKSTLLLFKKLFLIYTYGFQLIVKNIFLTFGILKFTEAISIKQNIPCLLATANMQIFVLNRRIE